ncbi:MAG: flagellar export protein FliJ [Azovibrio sp.]|uniref:flagellar export protein FliJ n=1 Tax=Azovibrio sp. TaxID=1872673 RepID=UPI003C706D03
MSQKFTLQPLLELMRERTDEASRRLGEVIAVEQSARSKLQLLLDYRSEYVQRFQEAQVQGLTLQVWQNYQAFLNKIDDAIRQQTAQVEASAQNTAAAQQYWQTQNTRLKAIDTLSARHDRKVQYQENRQEQKLLDEFASRHYPAATKAHD